MNTFIEPRDAYKKLRDLYYSARIESEPVPLFNNVKFTPDAQQTMMCCVGFIVGTYHAGNITLAQQLAANLCYQIQFLVTTENIREPSKRYGHTYKEISSDYSGMSFCFALRKELLADEVEQFKITHPDPHVHEVTWFGNTQYYITLLNGGIIFHGHRKLHCLEDMCHNSLHARWWSTHT